MVVICPDTYPSPSVHDESFEQYPYPISSFQKYAIAAIKENHHVLVTAHTGSGKTLPAEFAIEHWVAQKKKIIYTSPIKALSNQKYYDFTLKYPHISFGLFTGDIKANPEADVLIMTTEILMNKLFVQSDDNQNMFQMNFEDLAAVIFDEVHYINDPARGHVWEKCILLLPPHIQMVMLSATVENPARFAKWIETHHTKEVHICSTMKRVVPLSHYGFVTMPDHEIKKIKDKQVAEKIRKQCKSFVLLQDASGEFQPLGYKCIVDTKKTFPNVRVKKQFALNQLAKLLKEQEMLPAIAFIFSRKQVEECATSLTVPLLEDDSKVPYTVERECHQIIRRLSNWEEYAQLPEYIQLVNLLQKGIGIHHSGMIPVLREIVELCISKKYIKFLFATESFAIGLDCPIKTAVFVGFSKFDGEVERILHSHEYTQMAGRAGRRGIDTVGHVIHCCNLFSIPTQTEYKQMLSGKMPSLVSKFRLDYSLILNVIRNASGVDQIIEFVKKSMWHQELETQIANQEKVVRDAQLPEEHTSTVPAEEIAFYIQAQVPAGFKQTKNVMKKLQLQLAKFPTVEIESQKWLANAQRAKSLAKEETYLAYLRGYLESRIQPLLDLLTTKGWIQEHEGIFTLTKKGEFCASLKEVHGPIWSTMLERWNYTLDWDVSERLCLLSGVTNVTRVPTVECPFEKAAEMKEEHDWFEEWEKQNDMNTGINYAEAFHVNLMTEAMEWGACTTVEDCKGFIQTLGISVGDFSKAILKMAAVAKELREIDIGDRQPEWILQWTEVEMIILKYVAMNQSLYV